SGPAPSQPVGVGPAAASGPPQSQGVGPSAGEPARSTPPPAPRPAPPPRKPRREPPKPKLSQAALEGKVPLRTFGELSALFAAKKEPEKKSPPPEAVAPPPPTDQGTSAPALVEPAQPPEA